MLEPRVISFENPPPRTRVTGEEAFTIRRSNKGQTGVFQGYLKSIYRFQPG